MDYQAETLTIEHIMILADGLSMADAKRDAIAKAESKYAARHIKITKTERVRGIYRAHI